MKLSRAVGTNLPSHSIVPLLKELGKGMSEVQLGKFSKDFLTQQLYLSGSTVEQQLNRTKKVLYRKLEKPFVYFRILINNVRYSMACH